MTARVSNDARGAMMVEFVVAIIPIMFAFLGALQLVFIAVARMLVFASADAAARAAVVVVEDSADVPGAPAGIYGGSPAGQITWTTGGLVRAAPDEAVAPHPGDLVATLKGVFHGDRSTATRIGAIRSAAYLPLLVASPDTLSLDADTASNAQRPGPSGPKWGADDSIAAHLREPSLPRLRAALAYAVGMVAVTFPSAATGDASELTVRVSFLYRCRVPLVSLVLCDSGWALLSGAAFYDLAAYWDYRELIRGRPADEAELRTWLSSVDDALGSYERHRARVNEVDRARSDWSRVESPAMQRLQLLRPGARFLLLQADATLPTQRARYYPRAGGAS